MACLACLVFMMPHCWRLIVCWLFLNALRFALQPPFYSRDTSVMYNNILKEPLRLRSNGSQSAKEILKQVQTASSFSVHPLLAANMLSVHPRSAANMLIVHPRSAANMLIVHPRSAANMLIVHPWSAANMLIVHPRSATLSTLQPIRSQMWPTQ